MTGAMGCILSWVIKGAWGEERDSGRKSRDYCLRKMTVSGTEEEQMKYAWNHFESAKQGRATGALMNFTFVFLCMKICDWSSVCKGGRPFPLVLVVSLRWSLFHCDRKTLYSLFLFGDRTYGHLILGSFVRLKGQVLALHVKSCCVYYSFLNCQW